MAESYPYWGRTRDYWGGGYWGGGYWGKSIRHLERFEVVIADWEKVNIGTYVFEPDVLEPGLDNTDVPLRTTLAKIG